MLITFVSEKRLNENDADKIPKICDEAFHECVLKKLGWCANYHIEIDKVMDYYRTELIYKDIFKTRWDIKEDLYPLLTKKWDLMSFSYPL